MPWSASASISSNGQFRDARTPASDCRRHRGARPARLGRDPRAGIPGHASCHDASGASEEPGVAANVPHITATLFYADRDGQALVPVQREVPLAEGYGRAGPRDPHRAAGAPATEPYVSVIPAGTTLRAFYVTERGDAFVDLSREVSAHHPGGSFTELLTVYAIVNAVTANLPAIQRVQILVDGKEVDTLAGTWISGARSSASHRSSGRRARRRSRARRSERRRRFALQLIACAPTAVLPNSFAPPVSLPTT